MEVLVFEEKALVKIHTFCPNNAQDKADMKNIDKRIFVVYLVKNTQRYPEPTSNFTLIPRLFSQKKTLRLSRFLQ